MSVQKPLATTLSPSNTLRHRLVGVACAGGQRHRFFLVHDDGQLAPWTELPLAGSAGPHVLVAASQATAAHTAPLAWLFAAQHQPHVLLACSVSATGAITVHARTDLPAALSYLYYARAWLYATSYHGSALYAWPLRTTAEDPMPQLGPYHTLAHIPKAHAVVASPDARLLLSTGLGDDGIRYWPLDPSHPAPLDATPPQLCVLRRGSGPRHVRFHPAWPHLPLIYVITELSAHIVVLAYQPNGALLVVQERALCHTDQVTPITAAPWAAELQLSADGCWLFASERRSSTLQVFALDAQGQLGAQAVLSTETTPRGMALIHQQLVVSGQASEHLASYALAHPQQGQALTAQHALSTPWRQALLRGDDNPTWVAGVQGL